MNETSKSNRPGRDPSNWGGGAPSDKAPRALARRRLILTSALGGSASVAVTPWIKPTIESVLLPLHAQGSPLRAAGVYTVTYSQGGIGTAEFTVTAKGSVAGSNEAVTNDAEIVRSGLSNGVWRVKLTAQGTFVLSNVPCDTQLTTGGAAGVITVPFASGDGVCRPTYPVGVTAAAASAPNFDTGDNGLKADDPDSYLSIQLSGGGETAQLQYYNENQALLHEQSLVSGQAFTTANEIIRLVIVTADGEHQYQVTQLGGTNWDVTAAAVNEDDVFASQAFSLNVKRDPASLSGDNDDEYTVSFNLLAPAPVPSGYPTTAAPGTTLTMPLYFRVRADVTVQYIGPPITTTTTTTAAPMLDQSVCVNRTVLNKGESCTHNELLIQVKSTGQICRMPTGGGIEICTTLGFDLIVSGDMDMNIPSIRFHYQSNGNYNLTVS